MTPLPDDNLGKALMAIIALLGLLQMYFTKRGVKSVAATQTAEIQQGTNEQTTLIIRSINDVSEEVRQMGQAHAIEMADMKVRAGEFKKRLDGHDVDFGEVRAEVGKLRERVTVIENGTARKGDAA